MHACGWEFHACSNGDLGKFLLCDVCCAMEKNMKLSCEISSVFFSEFLNILHSSNYCLRLSSVNSSRDFGRQFFKWSYPGEKLCKILKDP